MTAGKWGRSLKYENPKDLEKAINKYFEECDKGKEHQVVTPRGQVVTKVEPTPYTVEGLGLAVGLTRDTLIKYGKREPFADIIARAKQKIYRSWAEGGVSGRYNAKIVALCLAANAGYVTKNVDEHRFPVLEEGIKELAKTRQKELKEIAKVRALQAAKKIGPGKKTKS